MCVCVHECERERTQGLDHDREVLYHWAAPPAPNAIFLQWEVTQQKMI